MATVTLQAPKFSLANLILPEVTLISGHVLTAVALTLSRVALDSPALKQTAILSADDFDLSAPVLAEASMPTTYYVLYDGNSETSGTAPSDPLHHPETWLATVKSNSGSLTKTGKLFGGWNTAANGSGTTYQPGASVAMPAANLTLYARWLTPPAARTPQGSLGLGL